MDKLVYEFPKLGIIFEMSPIAFKLGGLTVYWYGIALAFAFLSAILLALSQSEKNGISQDSLIDIILITLPVGIICARIYYILMNWSYYKNNLGDVYKIWKGGSAIYGGLLGGIILIYYLCKIKNIKFLHFLDFICVYLIFGQIWGRWGNFFNQELFGTNTDLPWGMTGSEIKNYLMIQQIPNVNPELPVHPTFFYEMLWSFALFLVLFTFSRVKKNEGEVFMLYIIGYGLSRVVIDAFRLDQPKVLGLYTNQLFGLISVVLGIIGFILIRKKVFNKNMVESVEESAYNDVLKVLEDDEEDM